MNEPSDAPITSQTQPPGDIAHRDRAVEPEYAAVSVMAILALILTGIGALALLPQQACVFVPGWRYKIPILLILPLVSFFFALASRRKIVHSEGTLVGLPAANAAVLLSALFVFGSMGLHGYLQHRQYVLKQAMLTEAQRYLEMILQDDYDGVYNEMVANNPAVVSRIPSAKRLQSQISALLRQGGQYYGRHQQGDDLRIPDDPSEGGEIQGRVVHRLQFEKGGVDLAFIFAQRNGQWKLIFVDFNVDPTPIKPGSIPKKRYEP